MGTRTISIHALREEGDRNIWVVRVSLSISIHALREEGDLMLLEPFVPKSISIHALREEGDSISMSFAKAFFHFYPRPPRGGRPPKFSGLWQ